MEVEMDYRAYQCMAQSAPRKEMDRVYGWIEDETCTAVLFVAWNVDL